VCKRCGYRWDVSHEQANAAYLRSQGRQPATPRAIEALPLGEQGESVDLLRHLGIIDEPEIETIDDDSDPGFALSVVMNDDDDGWTDELVLHTESVYDWIMEHKTLADLRKFANTYNVNLSGATRKDDILDALLLADVLTIVYNADGTILDAR